MMVLKFMPGDKPAILSIYDARVGIPLISHISDIFMVGENNKYYQ